MKAVANYGFAYKNVLYKAGDELDVTEEDLKFVRNDVTLLDVEYTGVDESTDGAEGKELKNESNKMLKKSNKIKTK